MGDNVMAEKKKQHFVPKFYMALFANSNKEFAVYNIEKRTCAYPVPYKNQCYKDYFYGKDGVWENKLSDLESKWADVFRCALERKALSKEQIDLLKQFALYQRQRTLGQDIFMKKQRCELLIECGKSIYADKGLIFDEKAKALCAERAMEEIAPAENLRYIDELINVVRDMGVVIINYQTNGCLISSDVPVIAINPFHKPSIGYGCMGLILLFPISSYNLVVIYDEKMYPRFKDKLYVNITNENEVKNLNALQLTSAEKILFAYDTYDFQSFSTTAWKNRTISIEFPLVQTLGSDTQKVIGIDQRKNVFLCEFSFGKMQNRFSKIPFSCREAVPRIWEQDWEDKLKIKIDLLPQILEHTPTLLTTMKLTKKECRMGLREMLAAAKAYWSS